MNIKMGIVSGVAAMLLSSSAGALTVTELGGNDNELGSGFITLSETTPGSGEYGLTFTWEQTPYLGYVDFSASIDFNFMLEDYFPDDSELNRSGFSLVFLGDLSTDADDTLVIGAGDYAQSLGQCASAGSIFIAGDCVLITGANSTDTTSNYIENMFDFGDFAAGNYRASVYDSEVPEAGNLDFTMSAVPLPAAGWMLLAGLGGMAALRRRTKL